MDIKKIAVDKLKAASYNPRIDLQPGDIEFEKLKRSIKEFGYVEPVIWNKKTGNVVGGHQRLKVLKHLGYSEVDCVVLDVDENKEKALNIALNKISGDWDTTLLNALLKDLGDSGFDVTLTGFDMAEVGQIMDDESDIVEDEEIVEEILNEAPAKPYSEPGDLWVLGRHRLLCGDSTNHEDLERLVDGQKVDLIVTDPPYNVNYEGSNGKTIQNDNMPEAKFKAFLVDAFSQMASVTKDGGAFYIWHVESPSGAFRQSCNEVLGKVRQILIWNKNSFVMGHSDYHHKYEPCIYGWKEGKKHYFIDDRTQCTVFEDKKLDFKKMKKEELVTLLQDIFSDKISTDIIGEDKPARNTEHPTMKPLKLIARLIKNSSKVGELVLDTFSGSGSTLITCEQTNRRCVSLELDPKYVDVIVKRYIRLKGNSNDVRLIRGGKEIAVDNI